MRYVLTVLLLLLLPSAAFAQAQQPTVSSSAGNNLSLKGSAGDWYNVYATNLTGTAGFLLILDSSSVPADGAVTPVACVPLPANGVASITCPLNAACHDTTGIVVVLTSATTCFTKTTGVITGFMSGLWQ